MGGQALMGGTIPPKFECTVPLCFIYWCFVYTHLLSNARGCPWDIWEVRPGLLCYILMFNQRSIQTIEEQVRGTNRCVFTVIESQMFWKRKHGWKDKVKNSTTSDLLYNEYAIVFIKVLHHDIGRCSQDTGPHFQTL